MKTRHKILIPLTVIFAIGLLFFNLWQSDSRDIEPPSLKIMPQRERIIQDLTEDVMSAKTYDDKLDAIQKAISQTNLDEFSHIVLTNLKSDYSDGEKIKTEYSHKYTIPQVRALAKNVGFQIKKIRTDQQKYFGLVLLSIK